jgi:hypothetical protein
MLGTERKRRRPCSVPFLFFALLAVAAGARSHPLEESSCRLANGSRSCNLTAERIAIPWSLARTAIGSTCSVVVRRLTARFPAIIRIDYR